MGMKTMHTMKLRTLAKNGRSALTDQIRFMSDSMLKKTRAPIQSKIKTANDPIEPLF
jgi:hypothetical protein